MRAPRETPEHNRRASDARWRTTDAARQVFTGEGVARCAAFHERRAQERDALADRPIDADDLLPDGVEWVAAASIVVDADATNYRPPPKRKSLKVRRKQRREDAEAVLQPANVVPCLAHGANGARAAVVTERLEERREDAAAPAPPIRLQVPTALRRRQRRSSSTCSAMPTKSCNKQIFVTFDK